MTSVGYSVEVNQDDVREALALFQFLDGNSQDAMRIAINKAGPRVRTKASTAIRQQVRLKASYLNERSESGSRRLDFKKASRSKLTGRITTPTRGLLLSRFSTDSNLTSSKVSWIKPPPLPKRGIRVKVKPKGSTKSLGREFFYMVLPRSRALAIVKRRAKGQLGPRGGAIDVAYGPSVSQVFTDVKDDISPDAEAILTFELLDAMRFLLQKKYPKE